MFYKAFGLKIKSEIPLPEVPCIKVEETFDVLIRFSDLSELWSELDRKQRKFLIEEKKVIFQISNVGIFSVTEGEEIIVSPMEGADEDQIRLYILGTCMGALLMQRRVLPLHGSTIDIDGKAYAIVGNRGAGKSTLTAAFLSRGFQFLTDDVIAVSQAVDGSVVVTPSYPQQKLWKESLQQFGMETGSYRSVFQRETKYAIPVHSRFNAEPLPLAGIFELNKKDSKEIEIRCIKNLEKLKTIYMHTFRNFLIPKMNLSEWHFNTSVCIANHTEVFQLTRPISGFTANELTTLILKTLNKEVETLEIY